MKTTMAMIGLLWLVIGGINPAMAQDANDQKGRVDILLKVPNLVGKTLTQAADVLRPMGLPHWEPESERDGELRYVIRQDPAAGTMVRRGTTVKLYTRLAGSDEKGRVDIRLPTR